MSPADPCPMCHSVRATNLSSCRSESRLPSMMAQRDCRVLAGLLAMASSARDKVSGASGRAGGAA
eukprot:3061928-Heterocapsa_arctica.AAC.1